MRTVTRGWRWLGMLVFLAAFAGTAQAQRTVTLKLNTATLPGNQRDRNRGKLNSIGILQVRCRRRGCFIAGIIYRYSAIE